MCDNDAGPEELRAMREESILHALMTVICQRRDHPPEGLASVMT